MSKKTGLFGAIGTITGRLSDLFFSKGTAFYGLDPEVIDPIGETKRQLPLDYFKSLEDNDTVATTGMTKKEFVKTLPWWARPAFKNTTYVGFVGPLHQQQIIDIESAKLQRSKPQEPNYSLKDISNIVYSMWDEAPDAPEELGPNFPEWVQKNEKMIAGFKDPRWNGILEKYASKTGGPNYREIAVK